MQEAQTTRRVENRQLAMRAALARLGIDRFVVSIHQASFPPGEDDIGYGTPYSARSDTFLDFLAGFGVNGLALGPAGVTAATDPSPYAGSTLSQNPLLVALGPLVADGLLDERLLAAAVARRPPGERVAYAYAWTTQRQLLAAAAANVRGTRLPWWRDLDPGTRQDPLGEPRTSDESHRDEGTSPGDAGLVARWERLREEAPWVAVEARFEAIAWAAGHDNWRRWPDDPSLGPAAGEAFELAQLLIADQHAGLRARASARGLALFADLAAGIGDRDRWVLPRVFGDLFLAGWAMGAPPSRTNPDGQPWNFPVLDPRQLEGGAGGAARDFAATRFNLLLASHDGLRIDHPHGWVCPWVYRPAEPVAAGARLHESPDLSDLAPFARVRPDQLDFTRPRHDDNWVRALEPEQVDRYAVAIGLLVERLRAYGGDPGGLMVEVLSTCPRPLAAVLARFGLGRFRVTQKARVDDPNDVYRADRAAPADWIMVGNHDTPPLRAVMAGWRGTPELARRAAHLAARLRRPAGELERDERALATAMVAELFLGPARNVVVFWPDLFGIDQPFNQPGVVSDANWTLRVPADFESAHALAVASGAAPDVSQAVAWALEGRGLAEDEEGRAIRDALSVPAR